MDYSFHSRHVLQRLLTSALHELTSSGSLPDTCSGIDFPNVSERHQQASEAEQPSLSPPVHPPLEIFWLLNDEGDFPPSLCYAFRDKCAEVHKAWLETILVAWVSIRGGPAPSLSELRGLWPDILKSWVEELGRDRGRGVTTLNVDARIYPGWWKSIRGWSHARIIECLQEWLCLLGRVLSLHGPSLKRLTNVTISSQSGYGSEDFLVYPQQFVEDFCSFLKQPDCHVKSLKLCSRCGLWKTDNAGSLLGDMLANNSSLTTLEITPGGVNCLIQCTTLTDFVRGVARSTTLEKFNTWEALTEQALIELAKGLSNYGPDEDSNFHDADAYGDLAAPSKSPTAALSMFQTRRSRSAQLIHKRRSLLQDLTIFDHGRPFRQREADALAMMLKTNDSLTRLSLGDPFCDDNALARFMEGVEGNSNLVWLGFAVSYPTQFTGSCLTFQIRCMVLSALEHNKTVRAIIFARKYNDSVSCFIPGLPRGSFKDEAVDEKLQRNYEQQAQLGLIEIPKTFAGDGDNPKSCSEAAGSDSSEADEVLALFSDSEDDDDDHGDKATDPRLLSSLLELEADDVLRAVEFLNHVAAVAENSEEQRSSASNDYSSDSNDSGTDEGMDNTTSEMEESDNYAELQADCLPVRPVLEGGQDDVYCDDRNERALGYMNGRHMRCFLIGDPQAGKTTLGNSMSQRREKSKRAARSSTKWWMGASSSRCPMKTCLGGMVLTHLVKEGIHIQMCDLSEMQDWHVIHQLLTDRSLLQSSNMLTPTVFLLVCNSATEDPLSSGGPTRAIRAVSTPGGTRWASLEVLKKRLSYWLRLIAAMASAGHKKVYSKSTGRMIIKPFVIPIFNLFSRLRSSTVQDDDSARVLLDWMNAQFSDSLDISPKPFVIDASVWGQARLVRNFLFEHTQQRLQGTQVLEVMERAYSHFLQWRRSAHRGPLISWLDFCDIYSSRTNDAGEGQSISHSNEDEGIREFSKAIGLYLHDIGEIIWFHSMMFVVLHPAWLCSTITGSRGLISTALASEACNGIVSWDSLALVLTKSLPLKKCKVHADDMINLLLRMGLSYEVLHRGSSENHRSIMIPACLPDRGVDKKLDWEVEQRADGNGRKNRYFGFRLACSEDSMIMLTAGFFHRLQVRLYEQFHHRGQCRLMNQLIWILANGPALEIYVEFGGLHGSWVDVMVQSPEIVADPVTWVDDNILSTVRGLYAESEATYSSSIGVKDLVVKIIRPLCVEKLILCRHRIDSQVVDEEEVIRASVVTGEITCYTWAKVGDGSSVIIPDGFDEALSLVRPKRRQEAILLQKKEAEELNACYDSDWE